MRLKEAIERVDKKYYGNPAIIMRGKEYLIRCVFASLRDLPKFFSYEIEDDNKPFDICPDGKTLIFRVK